MMDSNFGTSFLSPTEIISYPIEKYSHSSSAPTSSSHQWTHESKRDGLFLVFQNVQVHRRDDLETSEQHFIMSISSGGNILERQDLDHLLDMTKRFETMSQTMALNTTKIDAPVQIVVKCPCIAMRYTKDPTKIQRIQVRFKHDSDYEKSLHLFRNLGLPIKEATPAAAKGPSITPSGPNRQHQTEVLNQNQAVHPTTMQVKDSGLGNFRPSSALPLQNDDRPRSTSSGTLRPNSAASLLPTHMDRISRPFSSLSNSSTLIVSSLAPNPSPVEESSRNNKSSMYVNQLLGRSHEGESFGANKEIPREHKFPLHIFQAPAPGPLHATSSPGPPNYNAPSNPSYLSRNDNHGQPSSIYISQMQNLARSEMAHESIRPLPVNISPATHLDQAMVPESPDFMQFRRSTSTLQPRSDIEPVKSTMTRNNSLPMQSSQDPSLLRPQSVPNVYPKPSDHNWMPPKRELPFVKDRQYSKLRTVAESPLPTPKIAAPVVNSPPRTSSAPGAPQKVVKRVAQRNTKKMPVIQGEVRSGSPSALEQANVQSIAPIGEIPVMKDIIATSSNPGLPSKTVSSKRPSSAMENTIAEAKRPRMVDRSSQTHQMTNREDSDPLAAIPSNSLVCNSTPSLAPPPPNLLDQIDQFVTQNKARLPPVDPHIRPGYSEASEEERQATVNDWIIENLRDEDFLKLCEDVGNAWRRIGLGF